MLRHFFAAPDFLALLRFWNHHRSGPAGPAIWGGDVTSVPGELRPNVIVADWVGEPRYRYIGSECMARFGVDTTGQSVVAALGGAYAAYIRSLGDEVIARREPIFSASVFEVGDELILTGRLFTPFSDGTSDKPTIIMSVQLFGGAEFKLNVVGRFGFVNESQRLLIAGVPEVCRRLEEARRLHHLARAVPSRAQAREWAAIARDLSQSALVALQPYRDAIG